MEKPEEIPTPIETCTQGKSIDNFLAEFELEKVNSIVLKASLDYNDDSKLTTLSVIKDKKQIKWILSSIHKVKCLDDFILEDCPIELWLYEKTKLRMKIALSIVDENNSIIRFYRPELGPSLGPYLGKNDFLIDDKNFCSWLDGLTGKHFEIMVEKYMREIEGNVHKKQKND